MRFAAFLFAALFASAAQASKPACTTLRAQIAEAPAGPVFLASYPTAQIVPLKDNAYLYDNAVAAIALTGCGDVKDAARIGDAIVFALHNDPVWHDGRLRNAYQSGAAGTKPAKVAGWWDAKQNKWVEDGYQAGSDTGNQAWAMLALLVLYRADHDARYRDAATMIAKWAEKNFDNRRPPGFDGGTFGDPPKINRWKSTEHNTDVAAAFAQLAAATGDRHWLTAAKIARRFVSAMWDATCRCFDAGMAEDGKARNTTLALDAQVWPLMALPGFNTRYAVVLDTIQARVAVNGGYAYGAAKGGVWTEGTAQAALLAKLMDRDDMALLSAAEKNRAPDGSYFATDVPSLSTGFDMDTDVTQKRAYFHLPHLAALAWIALAQTGFNPFTGTNALPR
ncbi:MAG TPA: hypothetical protein VG867_11965 [Rhizomicrobium sp.]|nr:hypothetical protein [Rhizomicrobium sp.]